MKPPVESLGPPHRQLVVGGQRCMHIPPLLGNFVPAVLETNLDVEFLHKGASFMSHQELRGSKRSEGNLLGSSHSQGVHGLKVCKQ